MHNIDLPTQDELTRVAGVREPACVTIYVPTSAKLTESDKVRIEVKSRLREAVAQLEAAGTDAAITDSITNAVDELLTDGDFWRRQSNSLAIFVNRLTLSTFRVRDRLIGITDVSDRFLITPLLRAATFSHSAFILTLSQNSVRLIDVSSALRASEVPVPDLPRDLKSTVALDLTNDRNALAHLRNSEDPKVRMKKFSQAIDRALRPVLAQSDRPVVLAAKAIDTLFVDIDHRIPGYVDESSGIITGSKADRAFDYDVVDEIVRRALLSDARVIAVRADEVPGAGPVAAILRFAVHT